MFFKLIAVVLLVVNASLLTAEEICQSEACKVISHQLSEHSIKASVAPCDDFYEHVCGNYAASHPVKVKNWLNAFTTRQKLVISEIDEALLNAVNSSSKAIKYVAELYSECLDSNSWKSRGVAPLLDYVEQTLGAWPMIRKPKVHVDKKWPELFADVYSKGGYSYIFTVASDLSRTPVHHLKVLPGPLAMDPAWLYQPGHSNETVIRKYRRFLHNLASQFGVKQDSKLSKDIEAIIHLEQKLEKVHELSQIDSSSSKLNFFAGSLADFTIATHNKVDWLAVLNRLLINFNSIITPYNAQTHIEGRSMVYINEAIEVLNTTPVEVVQNFFGVVLALKFGPFTTDKLRQTIIDFNHDKDLVNITAMCPKLPANWPLLMGRIYVDTHFSAQEKQKAALLVAEIRNSFRTNLQSNTWLDSETKKKAVEKLDAIVQHIGFDDWILSDEKIDEFYDDLLKVTQVKGKFFENIVKLTAAGRKNELEYLPAKESHLKVTISPITVNAFYNRILNSITIPAGILQPPFFDHEMPWSMNYGAIGSIIGHEFTHGFDSNGRQFDLHGKLHNWWTNATLTKFLEKAKCIQEQYGSIHDPVANKTINGARTLSENIADNGGIKEAFNAYQVHKKKLNDSKVLPNLKFNSDQLFFVSYANIWCESITPDILNLIFNDAHSPNRYRVNVVMSNSPQFAQTFNCPVGSKMNPVKKCSVW